MATVRITADIRANVACEFNDRYQKRIDALLAELAHLDIGKACYEDNIPKKYRELAEKLNQDPDGEWLDEHNATTVRMYYFSELDQCEKQVTFMVPFKPPVALPKRFHRYRDTLQLKEHMEPYARVKEIFTQVDMLREELNKLKAQIVDGVLTNCTTLRQVLEVWPTALEFMPNNVRERHEAKDERRKAGKQNIEIDDDVKVSLMTARLLKN